MMNTAKLISLNRFAFYPKNALLSLCFILFTSLHLKAVEVFTYVWQPVEISFEAEQEYDNPYVDVTMWVDLEGPGFSERVYGFWDGGQTFKVRVVATQPGQWSYTSGSDQPDDPGLNGKSSSFEARSWSGKEIQENPNLRGIIRPSKNGHAFQYADGTPFFMVGDTWWAASTWRLPYRGEKPGDDYTPGPGISFEDLVAYRKKQGYNSLNIIAAYPNWSADHMPYRCWDENGVCIRTAWEKWGFLASGSEEWPWTAKDMHDEEGNRPFSMLPDRYGIPDYNSLNPAYFQSLDRKIHYLWTQGFIAMLEPVRRDACPAWEAYFDYNTTYARYVNYLVARYGAYNLIFSGIHLDAIPEKASLEAEDYNEALNYLHKTYGPPPFGQPVTTLINHSTYYHFGHDEKCPWLTMHSVGNHPRTHKMSGYIEELFNLDPPYPAVNLEPYYPGWYLNKVLGERPPYNSARDNYFARAQMYGCVLSGALGGHVYGHGGYDCTTTGEPKGKRPHIWEALMYESGTQMQHLKSFMLSEGSKYQDLTLASANISPRESPGSHPDGLDGWAFMMRTPEKDLAFLYFENQAHRATLSGFQPNTHYQCTWFDPRNGLWISRETLTAGDDGTIAMPVFPGTLDVAQTDWAAKLKGLE